MSRTLKGTDFVTVRCIANDISGAASAAYWLGENFVNADHQRRAITQQAAELADLLGMKLVPLDSTAAPAAVDLRAVLEAIKHREPLIAYEQVTHNEAVDACIAALRDTQPADDYGKRARAELRADPAATNAIGNLRHAEAMREEGGAA
nr:hypothetical protein [Paracoccus saliphilus]